MEISKITYMVTVQLHNLILFGHHGVYEEEKSTGNTFEVNLDVRYDEQDHPFTTLDSTVNYVRLFGIVQQRMNKPVALLEKLGDEIINRIRDQYPFVKEVVISIYKLHAPIGNFQGKAGVTLHKKFDE